MIEITNLDDKRIKEFISIKDKNLIAENLFIAETHKVIHKAINSKYEVLKILCTKKYYSQYINKLKDLNVYVAEKKLLENIVGFNLHHGVMALFQNEPLKNLNELGDKIMIFNGVTSPENVGTITRASAAFNFDSIIYDYKSASPFLRRCVRVSMGNIFNVRVHKSNYLPDTIKSLQDKGYTVIATANESGALSLLEFKYPSKVAIIIGNEGNGMDRDVIEACDQKLFIPIDTDVAHLNAASAATAFLYHSLYSNKL